MPFITWHLPVLNRLAIPWHWTIAEGSAMNVLDTGWCAPIPPRLSGDGTTEYLDTLRGHPRITIIQRPRWNGKTEQCNACLEHITQPSILMQMDADELWTAETLTAMVRRLSDTAVAAIQFKCRYFLGPNIVIVSHNTYGNRNGEWLRAWRYTPGQRFTTHEPPVLSGMAGKRILRPNEHPLTFDHYAYVRERQVLFKEQYYRYKDAVRHWRRLQENKVWPVPVKKFLPWVTDGAVADLLWKNYHTRPPQ